MSVQTQVPCRQCNGGAVVRNPHVPNGAGLARHVQAQEMRERDVVANARRADTSSTKKPLLPSLGEAGKKTAKPNFKSKAFERLAEAQRGRGRLQTIVTESITPCLHTSMHVELEQSKLCHSKSRSADWAQHQRGRGTQPWQAPPFTLKLPLRVKR